MNTVDASKTVERIVATFPAAEQQSARERLAKTFRYIIAQRLIRAPPAATALPLWKF